MKLTFEQIETQEEVRTYLGIITGYKYSFAQGAHRKWGDSDEILYPDNKMGFYQLMPDDLDNGFFNWYVKVRSKYQFYKSKEICVLHFVFYWNLWNKKGKPSYQDATRNEYS